MELTITLGLIFFLLSLALPAIGRIRTAARGLECKNNLRNISLALTQFEGVHRRLPASGNYYDDSSRSPVAFHTWAVSILGWVDQRPLAQRWDFDSPPLSAANQPLCHLQIPVYICPDDFTARGANGGDLSYAVNGGVGFTVRMHKIGDCVIDASGNQLDLNGNQVTCPANAGLDGAPSDRTLFKAMGVFFLENWKSKGTVRHHSLAGITDGLSQTFLVTDNLRTGADATNPAASFANTSPFRSAFYIGSPCREGDCRTGAVDYSACNSGDFGINSGIERPEGESPVPNSAHQGGVYMAYADGHVSYLSRNIDGATYAALATPQGTFLRHTALAEVIPSLEF